MDCTNKVACLEVGVDGDEDQVKDDSDGEGIGDDRMEHLVGDGDRVFGEGIWQGRW
jgi:hypothetical protein